MQKYIYFFSIQFVIFVILNGGATLVRAWYGPLPAEFCFLVQILQMNIAFITVFIFTSIVGFRFMFICVWKRMRQMDDRIVTKIILRCLQMISMFLSSIKTYFFTSKKHLVSTLYNAILRIARNFLETRENIKILTHPFSHINLG